MHEFAEGSAPVPDNPHFEFPASLEEACELLEFEPMLPDRAVFPIKSIAVFVRDHKLRELSRRERSLEVDFDGFGISQVRKGSDEARRMALDVSYGTAARKTLIAGREGRVYALGPEPAPDDVDPRSPAVVVWHDGEMFHLLASSSLEAEELLRIAQSVYMDGNYGRPPEG